MHVSGLFIYPVKSLRGLAVSSVQVDPLGLAGDRRFMIVDSEGRHLTQRTLPRMALLSAELAADTLVLRADGTGPISVPRFPHAPAEIRTVSIWRSHDLRADDCGQDASEWLSAFLGCRCHLVHIGEHFRRPVLQKPLPGHTLPTDASVPTIEGRVVTSDLVSFADGYPLLVTSEASLADLNDRIVEKGEEPVAMNRFRPNVVISNCAAFAEDTWPRVRIGAISLHAGGPSGRCITTTTDQFTGERTGPEPLRTLATYRRDLRDPSDVNFGQNFVNETKSGTLHVGDPVLPEADPTSAC